MDLFERAIFFAIGGGVGFILGYIVASLREIKEELDEVDDIVKNRQKDSGGFMRLPVVADILYLLVLIIVVYAAFASQKASNEVEEAQDNLAEITVCTQEYLAQTISALNERTTYTQKQAKANVELQRAQTEMLGVLLEEPPPSSERAENAFREYFDKLNQFVVVNTRSADKAKNNPYPTNEEFSNCLERN